MHKKNLPKKYRVKKSIDTSKLIYSWPGYSFPKDKKIRFLSTDLRDGLQQPGIKQPSIEESIYILLANRKLGVTDIEIGFPANKHQKVRALALVSYIRNENVQVNVSCLARTKKDDIDSVIEISRQLKAPVEVILIIGSSKLRRFVERWSIKKMEVWIRECISYAHANGLTVNFLTEDGSRTDPKTLQKLYSMALEEKVERVTLADTVGILNPQTTKQLVTFFKTTVLKNSFVPFDFHPHNDLGLAVANALSAFESGADRIHTTMSGVGERAGNVDLFTLATASKIYGIYDHSLHDMKEISQTASTIYGLPVLPNKPVVGDNAFATQTGMHAAAMRKAVKMGQPQLAEIVYAPYLPSVIGQVSRIDVGPLSGQANIVDALERLNIPYSRTFVSNIEELVENKGGIVSDQEIRLNIEDVVVKNINGTSIKSLNLDLQYYPVSVIKHTTKGKLRLKHIKALQKIRDTDFSKTIWNMQNKEHVETAALYLAMGGRVLHPFGNILAFTGHPDTRSVKHSNAVKGRKENQTGSVTTTPEHFEKLFDLTKLPKELPKNTFSKLLTTLYREIGPFGVRGPANEAIEKQYPLLIRYEHGKPHVQLIAVGRECVSHTLLRRSIQIREEEFGEDSSLSYIFFVTSANISSNTTGEEEPAHYYSWEAAKQMGYMKIPILGHETREIEQTVVQNHYKHITPKSTSILSFHYVLSGERPSLVLERHGSASDSLIRSIVNRFGFDLQVTDSSKKSIKGRSY